MTKKKLIKMYRAFFKTQGLEFVCSEFHPLNGKVVYDDVNYYIVIEPERNQGGMFFKMIVLGPDFPNWEGNYCWEEDPDVQKMKTAAKKINENHVLGKVNPDSGVTYSVNIPLQSPEQFKDFFYEAAKELKTIDIEFMDELKKAGFRFGEVRKEDEDSIHMDAFMARIEAEMEKRSRRKKLSRFWKFLHGVYHCP